MGIDYTKGRATQPDAASSVSTSKVTLTKASPAVSLTKRGGVSGTLRVNLNWNARPGAAASGGFFKRLAGDTGAIDLDLACLFEYTDGSKGVVQALGGAFLDGRPSPIARLDGDDRSGTNTAGENLFVDLSQVNEIRRILVFAFIYQGVPNWAAADGIVTLHPASGSPVEVRLDEHSANAKMCAVAMLENTGSDLSVRREVRYVDGHRELDDAYQWGLRWQAGRK